MESVAFRFLHADVLCVTSRGTLIGAEHGQSRLEFYDVESGALSHSMDGVKPFSVTLNQPEQVSFLLCEVTS